MKTMQSAGRMRILGLSAASRLSWRRSGPQQLVKEAFYHTGAASRRGAGRTMTTRSTIPESARHPDTDHRAHVNVSETFIRRPIATSLLMLGVALFGIIAYRALPVSDLPKVDFPTLNVGASLLGADPGTMASAVAKPLE